jgi:hypothetical protein
VYDEDVGVLQLPEINSWRARFAHAVGRVKVQRLRITEILHRRQWVYSILNFGGAVFDNLYMARNPGNTWKHSGNTQQMVDLVGIGLIH